MRKTGNYSSDLKIGSLCYTANMNAKVTINKHEYETLKRQAAAWRHAVGETDDTAIFNAVRDNNGEGIEAGVLAEKLRKIIEEDR